MTLAPMSARMAPALGAAIQLSISTTVISSRGAVTLSPLFNGKHGIIGETFDEEKYQGERMEDLFIRPYAAGDLERLYHICLLTGLDGQDATGTVDKDILGHVYAAPYALQEPELCFVLVKAGVVTGYILGTKDSVRFAQRCEEEWWPSLRSRYPLPDAGDTSRTASVSRAIHRGYQPPSVVDRYPAHLHIDILPEGQGRGFGRQLISRFCARLRDFNVPALHFGVSAANRKAMGFYRHLGFHIIEEDERSILCGRVL